MENWLHARQQKEKRQQMSPCFVLWFFLVALTSCQKKPATAPSADNFSAIVPPPMGADTYNDELTREIAILTDLLDQKTDERLLKKVKTAFLEGKAATLSTDKMSYQSHLTKVLFTLPELVHITDQISANRKLWYQAKFLFLKRRFIEAAIKMTEVLVHEPNFTEARNWRARAIFFLGNPDLAIKELEAIVTTSLPKSAEALDALYLMGAVVYESNDTAEKRLNTGINAWEKYLASADPHPQMKKEIEDSLSELKLRKEGKTLKTITIDPFSPSENFPAEKNAILVAFAKNEMELAISLADRFLKKTYDNTVATVKARTLFKQGQVEEAAKMFAGIVSKDSSYAPGYHYQGMAFMLKGEPENAITSWRKTVELDKAYANAHGLLERISVAEKMAGKNNRN